MLYFPAAPLVQTGPWGTYEDRYYEEAPGILGDRSIAEFLKSLCREHGIRFIDGIETLKAHSDEKLFHRWDTHWPSGRTAADERSARVCRELAGSRIGEVARVLKRLRRRSSKSKSIVAMDTTYMPLFERGLALDGSENLGRQKRFWMLVQLYRSTFDLPGETIEAGCLFGLSSFLMCHYSRLRDPTFTGKGHHVVDSFHGFDEAHEADFGPQSNPMIHDLLKRTERRGKEFRGRAERTLAEFPDVAFHEGWIPEVFATLPETRYRFVHVDVDLYEPTRASLEYFYPRLVETGVMVIDDYGFLDWPGCKVATDGFAAEHGIPIVGLPDGNVFLVKRP